MTRVCTIQELYALVPETKELEGENFKDTKHLISSVIQAVEKSGAWEFVQYIQGNPSLFAVREEIRAEFKEVKEVAKVMKATSPVFAETRKSSSTRVETPLKTVTQRVAEKLGVPDSDSPITDFAKHGIVPSVTAPTKYPWQK